MGLAPGADVQFGVVVAFLVAVMDIGAAALRTVPSGDLMAPPQLPRDAPVADIAHPVKVGLLPHRRDHLGGAIFDGFDGGLGQGLGVHPPLGQQEGLD